MEDSGGIKTDKKGVPATEEFTNETNQPKPLKRKFTLAALTSIGLIGTAVEIVGIIITSMKNSETVHLEQQIIEKDVIIAELQKAPTENDKDTAENGTPAINSNPLLHLDAGKCLNCYETPSTWSITNRPISFDPVALLIRVSTSAVLGYNVSWDALNEYYGYTKATNTVKTGSESNVEIELSGKVVDFLMSGFGNAPGHETILFLLEDGTVEYIPVGKATREGTFRSCGKIPGITDIVKLYVTEYKGYRLLAQRADGDYYDLSTILLDTGNYQY